MKQKPFVTVMVILLTATSPLFCSKQSTVLGKSQVLAQTVEDRKEQADQLLDQGIQQFYRSQYREAVQSWEQALRIYREIGDLAEGEIRKAARNGEASSYNNLGLAYRNLGDYQKAIDYHQQSLAIETEIGDRQGEARSYNNLGIAYRNLGDYQKAIDYHQQSLAIKTEIGDRQGEARSYNNLGIAYRNLGDYQKAIDYHQQSLAIFTEIGDLAEGEIRKAARNGEARSYNNLGIAYSSLGDYQKAISFYQQSLAIATEIGDRNGQGNSYGNLGVAYRNLGDYQKAISFYQQSLAIATEIGDRNGEARSYNNLGLAYDSLGDYQKAIDYHQQSLAIFTEIGDRNGEARSYGNLGVAYRNLGDYQKAISFYQQSLAISSEIGDRNGEARSYNNLGNAYRNLGDYKKAIDYHQQSLAIFTEIGDRAGQALSYNNLGIVYDALGDYQKAISFYQQSLAISTEIGVRNEEALSLANIGRVLLQQNQPEVAIIFLKASVNIYETIRQDITSLPTELQETYITSIEGTYRQLADLLLEQDRILEAQRVLDLLKVQELDDYFNNVRSNENTEEGVDLRDSETVISSQYNDTILSQLIRNGQQLVELEKIPLQQRSQQQRNQIISLRKEQREISQNFNQFLASPDIQDLIKQLQKNIDDNATVTFNLTQDIKLREALETMEEQGVRAGILYPFILEDRLELILVSAYSPPIRKTISLNKKDLNKTILLARNAIKSRSDNYQHLQQLYQWLIEPLETTLEEAKIDTIIYAPDGQLRYIPLAALHDGENWLINKYRFNNITALSLTDFAAPPNRNLQIIAGAFSEGKHTISIGERQFTFTGLPHTETEVQTLSQTISNTDARYNQNFNKDITYEMNSYGIVHLATHGKFVSGTPRDSFIVFGTGEHATLKDMETWNLGNVELVVLSACETGISDDLTPQVGELGNGVEVLGLGYQMQRRGAQATLASLWTVNDESTQVLMNEFYRNLQQGNMTKAEALQKAQESLIKDGNYNHPYHWAPFILIGNGL